MILELILNQIPLWPEFQFVEALRGINGRPMMAEHRGCTTGVEGVDLTNRIDQRC